MRRFKEFLGTTLVGGIVFLVPIVAIFVVIGKALKFASQVAEPFAAFLPFGTIASIAVVDMVGTIGLLLVCFLAGLLARTSLAKAIARESEAQFLTRIPGYSLLKGLVDSFAGEAPEASMRPVLMKLDDSSQLAFEVERLADGRVVLFVPGAPDPWSGAAVVVDAVRVEDLPITMMAAVQNVRASGRGTKAFLGTPTAGRPAAPAARPPAATP